MKIFHHIGLGYWRYIVSASIALNLLLHSSINCFATTTSHTSFIIISDPGKPYFTVVYSGNGVDHMNINLVDLKLSGLNVGDEIGIFDGQNCVGASVISEKNMNLNLLGIPASANDTTETNPNGYIPGHKITIKCYRNGVIYPLYFELVNDSEDIFEVGGSMFAFVNFNKSSAAESFPDFKELRIYPDLFAELLLIEFNVQAPLFINCEVLDTDGKLVKSVLKEVIDGLRTTFWDGKNNSGDRVPSGNYFIKINDQIAKVTLRN